MAKPLFLFVGKSSSGKTTIANVLETQCGYKQVESYTTRPPRYEGERGHIFITEKEFYNLGELAAYTYYNKNHYGTTFEHLNKCDIYVIDVPGVNSLLEKLKNTDRPVFIFYFDTSVHNRILRMQERGDGDYAIVRRLLQDEEYDWQSKLESIVWKQVNIENKHVEMFCVDANKKQPDVLKQVLYYIRKLNGDCYE